jgi:hypothetical protein
MFDPSADFVQIADATESVTFFPREALPGEGGVAVPHALRHAPTSRELAENHQLLAASDAVWHLSRQELGVVPRPGDGLLDAQGCRWLLLEVRATTCGARWRCLARNLVVVHGLDDSVTVLKASYRKGSGGAAEAMWVPWRTGIRAKIQPLDTRPDARPETRQTVCRYHIRLAEDLPLDHHHLIEGPDGTRYTVVAVHRRERLDDLPLVEVEVRR